MPEFGYVSVADIVEIYGVSRSFVYKKASTGKWGRYRRPDGTIRYRREQVDDSLGAVVARQNAGTRSKVRD